VKIGNKCVENLSEGVCINVEFFVTRHNACLQNLFSTERKCNGDDSTLEVSKSLFVISSLVPFK